MSSVFMMFQDRQIAVDEEPYSQLEWTDDSQSEASVESKKDEKEDKAGEAKSEEPVM